MSIHDFFHNSFFLNIYNFKFKNGHKSLKYKFALKMIKTIFFHNLSKIFFGYRVYGVTEKKFLMKFAKKIVFAIFGAKLDFNDL